MGLLKLMFLIVGGLNRQSILLNCLHDSIVSCKTFEQTIENTSDHLPVQLKINYYDNSCTALSFNNCSEMAAKTDKIRWSNYSIKTILTLYFNRKRTGKYESR